MPTDPPVDTTPTPQLPRTGAGTTFLILAALFLALGAGVTIAARRR